MVTILTVPNKKADPVEVAILGALRHSSHLRAQGKADEILVKDGKKPIVIITPQGDIEEIIPGPFMVSMGARLHHDVLNGGKGTKSSPLTPRQANAVQFARLLVGMKGGK